MNTRSLNRISHNAVFALTMLLGLLVAPMLPSTAAGAYNAHLRRYPYLTDLVETWVTINWATDQASTSGFVRWGERGTESCTARTTAATSVPITVNQVPLYQWRATLQLKPNTEYCYRVYLGTAPETDLLGSDSSPRFWSQLPTGNTQPFSFVVFGDWGAVDSAGNNPAQASIMRQIAASGARFALTTGDNGYPAGSQANYGDLLQRGQDLSTIFGPQFWAVAGASLPLFPTIGNHGISSTTPNHPHLLNWPQDHAVASSGGRYTKDTYCCLEGTNSATYASAWYAFDAGVARFYVLHAAWNEANVGTGDAYSLDYAYHWASTTAQYRWLAADLAAHPGGLKFAFIHYPIYSDNATEGQDVFLQGTNSLEGLLSRNGVNIAFSGHSHQYQRNRKLNDSSLVTYVTGGGGAKVQPIGGLGCTAIDAYGIGWSYSTAGGQGKGSACGSAPVPGSAEEVFHFLLVRINGTRVTVQPINASGRSFDVQTYDFSNQGDTQPPDKPTNLRATTTAAGHVDLAWRAVSDNVGVAGYTLYRDGSELATVHNNILNYTDDTVTPETNYRYTLVAFDTAGNRSARSDTLSVTTPPDTTPPTAPASLTARLTPGGVLLSWPAAADDVRVSRYLVMRTNNELARLRADTLTYTDATVLAAQSYTYTVVAIDAAGNRSLASPAVLVKLPAAPLPPILFVPMARR